MKKIEVKICGIKSLEEAKNIINLDIDYLGVIFAESVRKVSLKTATEISNFVKNSGKKCVGVFANLKEDEILNNSLKAKLYAAQIYGDYSLNLYKNLNKNNIKVWKVFNVLDVLPNLENSKFDLALFDYKGKKLGGNGVNFCWEILKNLEPFSFIIAGGIGTHNVLEAAKHNPKILDINSLVEDKNGIKDPKLIMEILKILKENGYK